METSIWDDLVHEQLWLLPDPAPDLDEPPIPDIWDLLTIEPDTDSLRAMGLADLARLSRSQFSSLRGAGLVDALIAIERHRAWLDGLARIALCAIADADTADRRAAAAEPASRPDPVSDFWCQEEVAAALRLAPVTAGHRLRDAQQLCHHLPLTLDALLDGRIWASQASAVVAASAELTEDLLPLLEEAVVDRAERQTLSQTARSARRAVLRLDASTARQRQARAFADRGVHVYPADDGMAVLCGELLATDALAINALLDAAADQQLVYDRENCEQTPDGPPKRTKPQAKADILVDLILGALDPAHLPRRQGRRPVINIHVGLDTLTGVNDEPGWLDGYGSITADTARKIADDRSGTWRRLITDPATQKLLAYDIRCYRPPSAVGEHVVLAHLVCTFPGCARNAERCDIDHVVAHSQGGTTTSTNLHTLCRRHHRLKHDARWHVTKDTAGLTHWTSPQGRRYVIPPRTRLTEPLPRSAPEEPITTRPRPGDNDDPAPF